MQYVKLSDVKNNPSNPRILKDEKFKKLLASIKEFPQMLEKRPLVCFTDADGKYVVLGGNMRLKATKDLKLKEIPIILADDWTEEQKKEFIIKDNVGYGEWDWDVIANEWDPEELNEWGLDVWENNPSLSEIETKDDFELPEGDKSPFQQMTFTLADEQAYQIKNAISDIKETEEYKYAETMGNENSNGNALYLIIMQWAEQKK